MDRSRQQNSRNQRMNTRNCDQYPMNNNQHVSNNVSMEDCPGMARDQLKGMPLAMAYVPWQKFENLYEECEAVYHGTIFCDLDLDFYGMRCQ